MAEKKLKQKKKSKHKPKRELITRLEYAKRKGVAPRTIGKYTQRKIIPLHDNKIDPVEADKVLSKVLVEPLGSGRTTTIKKAKGKKAKAKAKGGKDGNGNGKTDRVTNTYVEVRTEQKRLQVESLTMDVKLKRGEMVLTKDVEFAAFSKARMIRDKMLNIPDQISAMVAAERDETKVRDIIVGAIEKELRSISKLQDSTYGENNHTS